jgi:hypothetical protein
MKKVFLACCMFVIGISSCKKDKIPEPVVYVEENPIPEFLAKTGLNQIITPFEGNTNVSYEQGFSFKATAKGKINSLVIKLPRANPQLKVTIWDNLSKTVLRTENINIPTANTETVISIPTFDVIKDKAYFISINTPSKYLKKRSDLADITYPKTIGNISILGVSNVGGASQSFPINPIYNLFYGDISFKFQQTN